MLRHFDKRLCVCTMDAFFVAESAIMSRMLYKQASRTRIFTIIISAAGELMIGERIQAWTEKESVCPTIYEIAISVLILQNL